jgi:branched-chain amino acid transport system permease protein
MVRTRRPEASVSESEIRRTGTRSRYLVLLGVVAIVLLVPLVPFRAYDYVLQLGTTAMMWVALSSSWNIVGGYTGYISLGHNVFLGIGGYVSGLALAYLGISPFLSAPIAGLIAMAFGLAFGLITLRAKGPAFIIATIAMLFVVGTLFDNWEFAGASAGMSLPLPPFLGKLAKVPFYYAMVAIAFGAAYLGYRVAHSKFGLGLRALSQDETKAEVAGINTRWYKVVAVALSAFFIGAAGAIWGYSLSYLRPTIFFGISMATQMVVSTIIGGRGTVAGPVVGALLVVAVNEYSVVQFGGTQLNIVFTGVILLAVLVFFPRGVVGSLREARRLPQFLNWD